MPSTDQPAAGRRDIPGSGPERFVAVFGPHGTDSTSSLDPLVRGVADAERGRRLIEALLDACPAEGACDECQQHVAAINRRITEADAT